MGGGSLWAVRMDLVPGMDLYNSSGGSFFSGRCERCLISGGLKIISSQIVTQLSSRTCHRNHHPNHHLALHGDTFPENPSTLSQTQPSRQPRQSEISQLVELDLIRSSRNLARLHQESRVMFLTWENERV
ncbi:hypothetical protein CEXT_412021 [Caerostris extrusa]|uniref:Uncharacterized protein n=1 Tax=Caerostris extrusa TaxID=172846 RepID=A0AAV4UIA0_CAEEX|nr:hypothetical protein CEXT_412021 [Caerostris extrusa]